MSWFKKEKKSPKEIKENKLETKINLLRKQLKEKCNFLDIDSSDFEFGRRICTLKGGVLEDDQIECDGITKCIFHRRYMDYGKEKRWTT